VEAEALQKLIQPLNIPEVQRNPLIIPLTELSLTWYSVATVERVSCVACSATADGAVVYDFTSGVLSTRARTWVGTLLIDASSVRSTLSADHTLGSTTRGTSNVRGQT